MPDTLEWTARQKLARDALLEITTLDTIGEPAGEIGEGDGVTSYFFATTMSGYPGWTWTVSVAQVDDAEPTVLETELTPAEGALLAPDWVPWSDRMDDYNAAQNAANDAGTGENADDESDVESDDADDDTDLDDDDETDDDDDDSDDDDDDDDDDDSDGDDDDDDDSDSDDDDDDSDDSDGGDFRHPVLHSGDVDGVDIDEIDIDDDVTDDADSVIPTAPEIAVVSADVVELTPTAEHASPPAKRPRTSRRATSASVLGAVTSAEPTNRAVGTNDTEG